MRTYLAGMVYLFLCTLVAFGCSDGNGNGGECGNSQDCDDGNACTDDSCDTATGCVHENNTTSCDDGDACTSDDACSAGACVGGPTPDCNDGDVCTDDSCDSTDSCVYQNNTASCDDGDACTANDACSAGACTGGPALDCDDGNPCTDDSCDPASGCVIANNTATCDDGDACTTNDACSDGTCVGGSAPDCDDGDACTEDSCDPAAGCEHLDISDSCDDGNACTDDSCEPASGCVATNNSAACDDGDACTTNDACSDGSCAGGPALDCDDGDVCTDDSCDAISGCANVNNAAPCDDGDACTTEDICDQGNCLGGPAMDCDDDDICTDDSCGPAVGCQYTNNTSPCDDGDACSTDDVCADGICTSSALSWLLDYQEQNSRTDSSWGPVLTDIVQHCPEAIVDWYYDSDKVTHGHETTHGIDSDLRNNHNNTGMPAGGFYIQNDKAAIIVEPDFNKPQVGPYVPQSLRGSRYSMYVLSTTWMNPLYLWDEWTCYANGTAVGVNLVNEGMWNYGWRDACMGTLEFVVYGVAVGLATEDLDSTYFNSQEPLYQRFHEYICWLTRRSMELFRECRLMPDFEWDQQDTYYENMRTSPDAQEWRDYLVRQYGQDFLNEVLELP